MPAHLATAQADVDKKRLALSDAQADLDGTQLVAPFDGTVLKTNATAGDLITANTAILSLANLKTLQVVAAIDETTIRRVAAGQDGRHHLRRLPRPTLHAARCSPSPSQGTLQGGVMVYDVPISLTGADKLPLLVGMTANVQIQVAQVSNALLVPTMALQRSNGQYQVCSCPIPPDPSAPPRQRPGRGRPHRRHLHPDHQRPQPRRPGRRPDRPPAPTNNQLRAIRRARRQ